MLGKKFGSMKKLAKKIKVINTNDKNQTHDQESLIIKDYFEDEEQQSPTATKTPTGTFAVYVGQERQKFFVPTGYLSHPLFKILLDKAYDEFGFQQTNGLAVPCSVVAFHEVISAVECSNGKFEFGELVEEFILERNDDRLRRNIVTKFDRSHIFLFFLVTEFECENSFH